MCTALQVALVDLLAAWKILPARVVGHSSGEIAAAYCAGALCREDAWKIAYQRGVVSADQHIQKGAMLAVGLSDRDLRPYLAQVDAVLPGELVLACYNGPKNMTVSGQEDKIDLLKKLLDDAKVFARKLKVSNAYHSSHMKAVADQYLNLLGDVSIKLSEDTAVTAGEGETVMFSSLTGEQISKEVLATGQYWVDNMVSPVRFTQALSAMCSPSTGGVRRRMGKSGDVPVHQLVEVGPHSALQSACKDTIAADQLLKSVQYLSILTRSGAAVESALDAVGTLFCRGYPVDLSSVNHATIVRKETDSRQPKMLVDLPPYTFNHSQSFWPESRLSKNYRFRTHGRTDLLGAPVVDWDPAEPKWRQMIRVSEMPWLRDHVVTGSIVFPGVGYIVMAIEATKQLTDPATTIKGFRLRDISIKTALQIPENEDGIEVVLSMKGVTESSLSTSATWREFRIVSYNSESETWTDHCRGTIGAEFDEHDDTSLRKTMEHAAATCRSPVDMRNVYSDLETVGMVFGPLFSNLRGVKFGDGVGEALGDVTIPEVAEAMPKKYLADHVIHPATMDSMLHLFLAAYVDLTMGAKIIEPLVPVFIKDLWVNGEVNRKPGHVFTSHGVVRKTSASKHVANISVWDKETNTAAMTVSGMQTVPLQANATSMTNDRQLCYNVQWKPDIDLLTPEQESRLFEKAIDRLALDPDDMLKLTQDLQLATIMYMQDAVEDLDRNPPQQGLLPHHEKYLTWLRHYVQKLHEGTLHHQRPEWKPIMEDPKRKAEFQEEVGQRTADGKLLARMGPQIIPVMRQEADPLQLMFGDDILDMYYRETVGTQCIHAYLKDYLETLGHKRVDLKVLEVGAGTGGTTVPVLETLAPGNKTSILESYTYTDISAGFFETAKTKFKNWRNVLNFKTLNIEHDPAEQGFAEGYYDIVVAANVLHATSDLNKTLANVRSLLKPGGKLLLHEATQPLILRGPMCFGLLEGWWLGIEPIRQLGPMLDKQGWNDFLVNHDFNGAELALQDSKDPDCHVCSLIVSTALDPAPSSQRRPETIIVVTPSERLELLSKRLSSKLESLKISHVSVVEYGDLRKHNLKHVVCITLADLQSPVVTNMNPEDMEDTRHLLTTAAGSLWVTKDMTAHPEVALINGLTRSVRWERDLDESNLITLSLADAELDSEDLADQIARVFEYQFMEQSDQRHAEYYLTSDKILEINRLVTADYVNDFLHSKTSKPVAELKPLGEDPNRALMLSTSAPGLLNKLQFMDCAEISRPLPSDQVEVQIKATGLNFLDVFQAMGEVDGKSFGKEGSGVVTKVGDEIGHLTVGDRVMLLSSTTGCFGTYARTHGALAVKIPDEMSFETAAGIPVTFSTAYYCLVDVARLRKGESIL